MDKTIIELREIMYDLRPRAIDDLGLFAAVCNMSDNISRNFSIKVQLTVPHTERLEIKNELYCTELFRDPLSNVLKHSFASEYHDSIYMQL